MTVLTGCLCGLNEVILETCSALGGCPRCHMYHHYIALQHGTNTSGYMPQGDRFLPSTMRKIQTGRTSKSEMCLMKRE